MEIFQASPNASETVQTTNKRGHTIQPIQSDVLQSDRQRVPYLMRTLYCNGMDAFFNAWASSGRVFLQK